MRNNLDITTDTLMVTSPLDSSAVATSLALKRGQGSALESHSPYPNLHTVTQEMLSFLWTLGNNSCLPENITRAWFYGGLREDKQRLSLAGLKQNCGYLLRFLWLSVLSLCVVLRQDPARPGIKLSKLQPCLLMLGVQTCNCTRVASIA